MKNSIRLAASAAVAGLATVARAADEGPSMSVNMSPTSIAVAIAVTLGVVGSLWWFNRLTK